MRASFVPWLVVLAAAVPLSAQAGHGPVEADPTMPVGGSGQLPEGWALRFDPVLPSPGQPAPPVPSISDVSFTEMGAGLHALTGPAAIYFRPVDVGGAAFTTRATFVQARSMGNEAYGLFIGGSDLQGPNQSYLYFVVRPSDGGFLINHRTGDLALRTIVDWTVHGAVRKETAEGSAGNQLAIEVSPDAVRFLANGVEVYALAGAERGGVKTHGIVGLRINHNLDLQIAAFGIGP